MDVFVQTALSFPTVLFSFLLCLAMLYWCVAALGILEVDLLDIEADSALDSVQPEGLAVLTSLAGPLTRAVTPSMSPSSASGEHCLASQKAKATLAAVGFTRTQSGLFSRSRPISLPISR